MNKLACSNNLIYCEHPIYNVYNYYSLLKSIYMVTTVTVHTCTCKNLSTLLS